MIADLGLIVASYVIARAVSALTWKVASGESLAGKIAYGLCGVATGLLSLGFFAASPTH